MTHNANSTPTILYVCTEYSYVKLDLIVHVAPQACFLFVMTHNANKTCRVFVNVAALLHNNNYSQLTRALNNDETAPSAVTTLVLIFSLCNFAGRLLSGTIDYIPVRRWAYILVSICGCIFSSIKVRKWGWGKFVAPGKIWVLVSYHPLPSGHFCAWFGRFAVRENLLPNVSYRALQSEIYGLCFKIYNSA